MIETVCELMGMWGEHDGLGYEYCLKGCMKVGTASMGLKATLPATPVYDTIPAKQCRILFLIGSSQEHAQHSQ